jgi:hypothetical protein
LHPNETPEVTPEERLAIAEQRLKCLTGRRESQMGRMERLFRRIRYPLYGLSVMIVLWILANHFWR